MGRMLTRGLLGLALAVPTVPAWSGACFLSPMVAAGAAAAELQRLEKIIAAACDGEPVKDLVFKKLPQLHTLVLKLDARLSDALSAGAKATDPDKQLDLDKATRKLVGEYQGALRNHPLAAVVDNNPFGSFQVMQTLEAALAKIQAEFN